METEKTAEFEFRARITFVVDDMGSVVGIRISPDRVTPPSLGAVAGMSEEDASFAGELAANNGWDFPALLDLPAGITWEA